MKGTAGRTLQAVLACIAVLIPATAGDPVQIISLDWTTDPNSVTVCASEALETDEVEVRLLAYTGVTQTAYPASEPIGDCPTFDVSPPSSGEQSAYELLVLNTEGVPLQQGAVQFTLTGERIDCSGSPFARVTSGYLNATGDTEACLSDNSVCYSSSDNFCILGLDEINSPDLSVCVPDTVFSDATAGTQAPFSVESLWYKPDGATFVMSDETATISQLTELLIRPEGEETYRVTSCGIIQNCELAPFTPDSTKYDLCGVYTTLNEVKSVGTTTFQDLKVTLDTTESPITFHFVRLEGEGKYEVYHGITNPLDESPSNLDCSLVPVDGICYGVVVVEEEDLTNVIAVSYPGKVNAIAVPILLGNEFVQDGSAVSEKESPVDPKMPQLVNKKSGVTVDNDSVAAPKRKGDFSSMKKKLKLHNYQLPGIRQSFPTGR